MDFKSILRFPLERVELNANFCLLERARKSSSDVSIKKRYRGRYKVQTGASVRYREMASMRYTALRIFRKRGKVSTFLFDLKQSLGDYCVRDGRDKAIFLNEK